ncbi:E3 ubiquitin-protein ligase TRIM9-like isoform X1 [Mytilus edulis]|uniref:E3 ubiquitin-protein ligase TRIM9-like isoform X1 n=2 Tax=Mytilus edulis TaxID=6550 RepID=UPI0039EF3F8D
MDEELKCPECRKFYSKPVFFPCSHSVCLECAGNMQESSQEFMSQFEDSSLLQILGDTDLLKDYDKLSLVSETDSGVVCNSRPSSYIGSGNILPSVQGSSYIVRCPVCKKPVFLDESGYKSLPKNTILEAIVEKYCNECKQLQNHTSKCQMCEQTDNSEAKDACSMCEQCEIFYCDTCKDVCHPSRGPLAKHNMVGPIQGRAILRAKNKASEAKCIEHEEEHLSMYCLFCKLPVCYVCRQEGRHVDHDVQALGVMSKTHKTELSHGLQSLSEKAKAGTEFIQRLKGMSEKVHGNCTEFEARVVAQCDALIESLKKRKLELIENVHQEREMKVRVLKEQVTHCTSLLQKTTGLLHFCIEVLKEGDPASFLQVSNGLLSRVNMANQNFNKDIELVPRVSPEFELTLDSTPVQHSIQTMNFFQMKAPGKPTILPEECSAENNSVTIVWQPHSESIVDNYYLEIDDGNGGDFRVVYVGRETMCTVDGLHFNSLYYARVKAGNYCGESNYSDPISLQTAELAWFHFDPVSAHPDILFSNDNQTVTCNSYDHRVVLGSVGFSKGVHYWEIVVDRYDCQTDPAIGIARFDVGKCFMLGKDDKAWSMYIDDSRSWFLHNDEHRNRTDGGIQRGSVIGILLNLEKHLMCYYVDEQPHGPIAFNDLRGVFFPAVSINRNVQVTLRTGLAPPPECETENE